MRLSLLFLTLTACAHRLVVREAPTYTLETAATVARQEEAAEALLEAAEVASEAGDWAACTRYAAPALLIEATARPQANRALWLAGLPYPDPETGETPARGTEQPDPGPSPAPRPVTDVCGPEPVTPVEEE